MSKKECENLYDTLGVPSDVCSKEAFKSWCYGSLGRNHDYTFLAYLKEARGQRLFLTRAGKEAWDVCAPGVDIADALEAVAEATRALSDAGGGGAVSPPPASLVRDRLAREVVAVDAALRLLKEDVAARGSGGGGLEGAVVRGGGGGGLEDVVARGGGGGGGDGGSSSGGKCDVCEERREYMYALEEENGNLQGQVNTVAEDNENLKLPTPLHTAP